MLCRPFFRYTRLRFADLYVVGKPVKNCLGNVARWELTATGQVSQLLYYSLCVSFDFTGRCSVRDEGAGRDSRHSMQAGVPSTAAASSSALSGTARIRCLTSPHPMCHTAQQLTAHAVIRSHCLTLTTKPHLLHTSQGSCERHPPHFLPRRLHASTRMPCCCCCCAKFTCGA